MTRPVMAILSQQDGLSAKARRYTGDANEAGLIVGKVISRAFLKFREEEREDVVSAAMWRDFDAMIEERRAS